MAMPISNWKRLDAYAPGMRLIAAYARQQDPTPLPVEVRTALGISRSMWLAWSQHAGDAPLPGMTISHAMDIARYFGQPVHAVIAAAGLRPADDPLFDREGAWAYVMAAVERLGAQGHLEHLEHLEHLGLLTQKEATELTQQLRTVAALDLGHPLDWIDGRSLERSTGWTQLEDPEEWKHHDTMRDIPQWADETSGTTDSSETDKPMATGAAPEVPAETPTGAADGVVPRASRQTRERGETKR